MTTGKKIMLVDDDPEDRSIIHDAFTELGVQELVHYEENGEYALQFLEQCYLGGSLPPLVILDLNMPRMNGTEALQAVKKDPRFRSIYVIIFSTTLNPIEKQKCIDLGAEEFLVKPVLFAESIATARDFRDTSYKLS